MTTIEKLNKLHMLQTERQVLTVGIDVEIALLMEQKRLLTLELDYDIQALHQEIINEALKAQQTIQGEHLEAVYSYETTGTAPWVFIMEIKTRIPLNLGIRHRTGDNESSI